MFKKPLSGTKTSAPLRSSDRRKLKQKIITTYSINAEDGDALVPEGLLSMKFSTHLDEPGVVYLSQEGDPLWFTVGKGSDDVIPTVYTLWKLRDMLPTLSTPPAVIPVLIGGADLMIPGVIHHTPSLNEKALVSILQYNHSRENPTVSPPLAIGRMALSSDKLQEGGQEKGKAVLILHTWKDYLWGMGSKCAPPEPLSLKVPTSEKDEGDRDISAQPEGAQLEPLSEETGIDTSESSIQPNNAGSGPSYTPQEISDLLHISLLQCISLDVSDSQFPMSAPSFFANHILPSRPAYPGKIVPHSGPTPPDGSPCPSSADITIKNSTYKSLIAFLKAEEKKGLLTLKSPPRGDAMVTAIKQRAPEVEAHRKHVSINNLEATAAKQAAREEKAKTKETHTQVEITELYKPHQASLSIFEATGANTSDCYTATEVKTLLNSYISSQNLVNPRMQTYINLDAVLLGCVSKSSVKSKAKDSGPSETGEYLKREELLKALLERMQSWYEINAPGKDPLRRKGQIVPIQVTMKIRQGRKACTLITGFEPYLVLDAEDMAEDLRKACAGSTAVSPIPGKGANSGFEVFVQGKQERYVREYLIEKGIPKKWIEVHDLTGKK